MKIEKTVETFVEVTVEVTIEDIIEAIAESTDTQEKVFRGLTNAWRFLQAVPDEIIAGMTDKQREVVHNALDTQTKRYAVNGSAEQT